MPSRSIPLALAVGSLCLIVALIACALPFPQQQAAPQPPPQQATQVPDVTASPTLTASPSPVPPTAAPTLTPTPTPIPASAIMAEELAKVEIPPLDPIDWFTRVGLLEEPVPPEVSGLPTYHVGSRETFTVIGSFFGEVDAELRYQNDVVAMWVESGFPVDDAQLAEAADTFANEIYPTVREVFGEEWSPGIDGNPRIFILNVFLLAPNVLGQFVPPDEYPVVIFPFSNQHEMFYMSLLYADVGSDEYMSALTHEFQHMVQWHTDSNETIWMNEGFSQVAERIAGYDEAFTHYNYLFDSRVQLNTWSKDFRQSYSNYGAAYLFLLYLKERLGQDVIAQISHNPQEGLLSIDQVLAQSGLTVDDLFADWVVANYVNDPVLEDGRYGYQTEDLIPICPRRRLAEAQTQPPRNTLPQYTANYVELEGEGEFTINFKGEPEVRLIPTSTRSGDWMWWSGSGDNSDMALTHAFDLRDLQSATLQFWTWYDIDDTGDYGFVLISTDGGQKWDFLQSHSMVTPEWAEEYGPHFTGGSGGGRENPQWSHEEIDLSHYVGQEVLIRFEYVTDTSYTGHGWAVDDVRIPELDFMDDMEQSDSGWEARGFARITNAVPQKWAVYLVEYDGGTSIRRLELDADNAAQATVTLPPNGHATVIVGAMAPFTKVQAQYSLQIGGSGRMATIRPQGGVLFEDNFESPCSTFYSFILPDYSFGYRGGRYEIEINTEDALIFGNAQQELGDVVIDVDTVQVKATADSTTGVMCRFQDAYNFYDLSIRNDGTFAIGAFVDGYYEYLLDWTPSEAINTGEGAINHLTAICNGNELSLSVNGTFLGSVKDSKWRRGDIGFSAGTFVETGALVAFDNLVVTRP